MTRYSLALLCAQNVYSVYRSRFFASTWKNFAAAYVLSVLSFSFSQQSIVAAMFFSWNYLFLHTDA